jgi:hypothetical protein
MKKTPIKPPTKGKSKKNLELEHCEPGDPCERTIEVRPDGTVYISALCGEILPVARALDPDLREAE